MAKSRRPVLIVSGSIGVLLALTLCVPFLALGAAAPRTQVACGPSAAPAADGTPSIIGTAEITAAAVQAWWRASDRGQPFRLQAPVAQVIEMYLDEGAAEGVRGDLAFAQAVVETGWFTNSDTARNNFAGIAHYDTSAAGSGFANVRTGIRAQIQLLKKFADGNAAHLAHEDTAPRAGAHATTWGQLAGRWASDPRYWTTISRLFESIRAGAATGASEPAEADIDTRACTEAEVGVVGDYALPVDRIWWEKHPDWFTRPHHDYPAVDIPVPAGTPVYAVTNGTIASTPTTGRCGYGIVLNGTDKAQYTYCHGLPGSQVVKPGDSVQAGQRIMTSASTGNSTGPHLHFAMRVNGTPRCPHAFLVAVAQSSKVSPSSLPGIGCTQKPT